MQFIQIHLRAEVSASLFLHFKLLRVLAVSSVFLGPLNCVNTCVITSILRANNCSICVGEVDSVMVVKSSAAAATATILMFSGSTGLVTCRRECVGSRLVLTN